MDPEPTREERYALAHGADLRELDELRAQLKAEGVDLDEIDRG
jgi:hypothetical protein